MDFELFSFFFFFLGKSTTNLMSFSHSRLCNDLELPHHGADTSSTPEHSFSLSDMSRKTSWPRKSVTLIQSGGNTAVHVFSFALPLFSEQFAIGGIFLYPLRRTNVYLHADNGE